RLADEKRAPARQIAPRTPTEIEVARIWRDVLGLAELGVTDEFFAVGGTSLQAVRIAGRIEQAFKKRLPMSALLRGATIETVASALDHGGASTTSSVVALQKNGDRRPLFFVHPLGGNVFCYDELATALGPSQPFYALRSRGLEADETPLATIEEM